MVKTVRNVAQVRINAKPVVICQNFNQMGLVFALMDFIKIKTAKLVKAVMNLVKLVMEKAFALLVKKDFNLETQSALNVPTMNLLKAMTVLNAVQTALNVIQDQINVKLAGKLSIFRMVFAFVKTDFSIIRASNSA